MAKLRSDSWDSQLKEEDAWTIYFHCRPLSWTDAVNWISAEYSIDPPSKSAYYRFSNRMRSLDAETRLQRAAISVNEAANMADRVGITDEDLVKTFKSLAADAVMTNGDAETASRYVQMAVSVADRARAIEELKVKQASQQTKDEQLRLAREKFEAAQAQIEKAKSAVSSKTLTPEERQNKLKEIFGL